MQIRVEMPPRPISRRAIGILSPTCCSSSFSPSFYATCFSMYVHAFNPIGMYIYCTLTYHNIVGLSQGGNFVPPSQWQESGTNCQNGSRDGSRKETTPASFCCASSRFLVGFGNNQETSHCVARRSGDSQGELETTTTTIRNKTCLWTVTKWIMKRMNPILLHH